MKILSRELFLTTSLALLLASCDQKADERNESDENTASAVSDDEQGQSDLRIENSSEILAAHTADLNALSSAAGDIGLDDIASNSNILATIYDFTVQQKVKQKSYGEAVFEWNKADLDYKRLELAYDEAASSELSDLWFAYQDSRATMLEVKVLWQNYED